MKNKLSTILGSRKENISELSRKTGIARSTLTAIYYDESTGIKFDTLKKICDALEISPGDFFVYEAPSK